MVREGLGAAWLPLTLTDDDLRSGRLVRAGESAFDIPVDIRLFRSPVCRSQAADQLWDQLNGSADTH